MITAASILCGIYILFYLVFAYKTGHLFKTVFCYVFGGILLFFSLIFSSKYTGITMELNPLTVGVSAAGGLPGIVLLLTLPMIF